MWVRAALRPAQVSEVRCGTKALGRRNQRLYERSPACNCEHARPTTSPHEKTRCRMGGAFLARTEARWSRKVSASSLKRPPISTPTTTRPQRSPLTSSEHLRSLSARALTSTTIVAAFGHAWEADVRTDRSNVHNKLGTVKERQPCRQSSACRLRKQRHSCPEGARCTGTVAPRSMHTRKCSGVTLTPSLSELRATQSWCKVLSSKNASGPGLQQ